MTDFDPFRMLDRRQAARLQRAALQLCLPRSVIDELRLILQPAAWELTSVLVDPPYAAVDITPFMEYSNSQPTLVLRYRLIAQIGRCNPLTCGAQIDSTRILMQRHLYIALTADAVGCRTASAIHSNKNSILLAFREYCSANRVAGAAQMSSYYPTTIQQEG